MNLIERACRFHHASLSGHDCDVLLVSKEDAIASKILWIREGSEKSRNDIIGMLLDPGPLDLAALGKAVCSTDCEPILEQVENEVHDGFGEGYTS